jgi:hypothetical protein
LPPTLPPTGVDQAIPKTKDLAIVVGSCNIVGIPPRRPRKRTGGGPALPLSEVA